MMTKLPYWLVITDKVKVGDSKMFRVRINPKYKEHKGVLAHEETHIQYWYLGFIPWFCVAIAVGTLYSWNTAVWFIVLGFGFKDLLYTFVRKARLKMEVLAYRNQIEVEDGDYSELYAEYLASPLYDLRITKEEALRQLRGN